MNKNRDTGIEGLTISTTRNAMGQRLSRYVVTVPKVTRKSFYFSGKAKLQETAFLEAIQYMKRHDLFVGSMRDAMYLYRRYDHEWLLN